MEAVTNRHSEIALRLLYNGANLHLANLNGDTAVILAAETDAVSVLNMLITSCGADIFDTNDVCISCLTSILKKFPTSYNCPNNYHVSF